MSRPEGGRPASAGGPGVPGRALTDTELLGLLDRICYGDGACSTREAVGLNPVIPAQPAVEGEPAEPADVVTITDLARFLPATVGLHAEPDGWAVVGVPANFWVEVAPVTVSGELLGGTAQVRFTPRAYRFDYGDGTVRTSGSPGASWAALGQEELTPTPTDHVYRARGDRSASVTVIYSAQYRVGDGPWIGVAGAVSGTTPPQATLVVVERTALTTPA